MGVRLGALLSRTVARDLAWVKVWWMQGWSPWAK